jgi:hypothetical protein
MPHTTTNNNFKLSYVIHIFNSQNTAKSINKFCDYVTYICLSAEVWFGDKAGQTGLYYNPHKYSIKEMSFWKGVRSVILHSAILHSCELLHILK